MFNEHWFDLLGKSLLPARTRRTLFGIAVTLAADLALGGASADGGASDPCNAAFRKKRDRDFCKTKRKRCQRAGTTFCIHSGEDDQGHPDLHATCCPAGEACCAGESGDRCVDTLTSVSHCGACANACDMDETCVGGACVPFNPPCSNGGTLCAGACVDTATDRRHCGACGARCAADQICVAGTCVCTNPTYVFFPVCGYCLPPNYICCGPAPAGHCPNTHVCELNTNGTTYRCAAR